MTITQPIGIDFDNTIVSYDKVFYKYALKSKLILRRVSRDKQAVRDAIRALPHGNDKWTFLQGLVYGRHMDEAELVEGVEDFLAACRRSHFKALIISHKGIYPALGPRINLRAAARKWLKDRNFFSRFGLTEKEVIFEQALKGKFEQIAGNRCAYFIDDLKENLVHPDFPKGVTKILYSRRGQDSLPEDIIAFKDWNEIREYFFA